MDHRRRPALAAVAAAAFLAASLFTSASHSQQQGTSCNTLNKVYSPTWMGHNDNTTYICDGSVLQTLWLATASPIALGIGTTSPVAGFDVLNPVTSASGVAYGARYQQTLTAAANGDALTALYINPAFANGSFTGVANNALIVTSGNVGIGTASPAQLLEVNGTAKIDTGLIVPLIYPPSDSTTAIQIDKANGSSNVVDIDTTNGRVGIGTASPSQPLTVSGNALVTGTLYIGNTSEYFYGSGSSQITVVGSFGTQNGIIISGSNLVGDGTYAVYGWNYGNNPFPSPANDTGLSRYAAAKVAIGNGTQGNYSGTLIAGSVGIGSTLPVASLDLSQKTDAVALPVGTTGQRPAASNGMIRYNSSTPAVEAYVNGAWTSFATSVGTTITLGASATATNPQVSGDGTTGFYTSGAGHVDVSGSGTQIIDWSSAGENIVTGSLKLAGVNGLWQDNTNFNTAVGDTAFPTTVSQTGGGTHGQADIAIGYQALNANTTGADNIAVGYQALYTNITGVQDTAVGTYALNTDTTGGPSWTLPAASSDNSAFGYAAAAYLTTGDANTALGAYAMIGSSSAPLTGNANTAIGTATLVDIQGSANGNTAAGYGALFSVTTGASNTAVGYLASQLITTGTYNAALGTNALAASGSGLTGSYNTAVGYEALYKLSGAASSNVAVGYNAGGTGLGSPSGSNNVYIGAGTLVGSNSESNDIVIGYAVTGLGSNTLNLGNVLQGSMTNQSTSDETLYLQSATSGVDYVQIAAGASGSPGTVTISAQGADSNVILSLAAKGTGTVSLTGHTVFEGVTSTGATGTGKLMYSVSPTTSGTLTAAALTASGSVTFSGLSHSSSGDYVCMNTSTNVIEYNATACGSSLRKMKQEIKPLTDALPEVLQLQAVEYRFRPEYDKDTSLRLGFIAEDIEKIDPRLAAYNGNGELTGVDYEHVAVLGSAAIQEQQKEIEFLRHEIDDLKRELSDVKARSNLQPQASPEDSEFGLDRNGGR